MDAFYQWLLISSVASFAISYTLGTLTFVILRKFRCESVRTYAAIGGLLGLTYGVILSIGTGFTPQPLAPILFFTFLELSVATTFALIRGIDKNSQPIP